MKSRSFSDLFFYLLEKSRGSHFLKHLMIHRPEITSPSLLLFLFTYFLATGNMEIFNLKFLMVLTSFYFTMAFIHTVNQVSDREEDELGRIDGIPKTHMNEIGLSLNTVKVHIVITAIISMALAFAISPILGIVCIIYLCWGVAYSLPPLRLKARPFLDVFSWVSGYVVFPILTIYIVWGGNVLLLLFWMVAMILFTIPNMFARHFVDYEVDTIRGNKTTTIYLGIKKTTQIGTITLILANIAFLLFSILKPEILFAVPAILLVSYKLLGLFKNPKTGVKAYNQLAAGKFTLLLSILLLVVYLVIYLF